VSRTNIYRANSPTIYARVMNLNFIAYIVKHNLRESFHYIFNHAKQQTKKECMRGKTLKHKPILSIKPFPLNPLNFSPIGNKCQNGWTNLEGQYSMSSSPICAFLIKGVESYALIQKWIFGGNQTILRIKDCKRITRWRKLQRMKQAIKRSEEPIGQKKYHEKSERVL